LVIARKAGFFQNLTTQAGMQAPPPETVKNRDVFDEPIGTYSRRISGGGTCAAAIVWH